MLKPFSLLLLLAMAWHGHAMPELKTVGEGSYRYLFWQLYDARLATVDGAFSDYQKNAPVLLELTYKRDITKQQFIDATVDEWKKLGHSSEAQQQQWSAQLQNLWQDVKQGDRLAALLLDDGRVQFYFNGVETMI